jgi:hypothetical protein
MISGITGSAGVMITGGSSNPYINMNNASAGMVRYNGSNMEVYDGSSWLTMGSYPTIQLTADVQNILHWAEKKMREEQTLEQRMTRHPGLRDAYEKFRVMDALTLEEKHNNFDEVQAGP